MKCRKCDYNEVRHKDQLCEGCRLIFAAERRERRFQEQGSKHYIDPIIKKRKNRPGTS